MTEFLGTDGGQIAHEVTGLTADAEQVVAALPELVWDLVADVTRVGGWSPECIRAAWLAEPGRPQPGARFTGHNRFPNGSEYEVTCVVTEADRPPQGRPAGGPHAGRAGRVGGESRGPRHNTKGDSAHAQASRDCVT